MIWANIASLSKIIQNLSLVPLPVECPDVYIVERLFSSSLVVVVSLSMPRRMNVYHFKKGTEICNYSYSNNILSVRLNRQVRQEIDPLYLWSCCFCFVQSYIFYYGDLSPSVTVTSAAGGVPGGVGLHPQYQRHETTQNPAQHTHQPHGYTQTVIQTSICRPYQKSVHWFLLTLTKILLMTSL